MALLSLQQIVQAGTQATYSAVNASDTATLNDDLFLHVKNGGGSPDTVTIVDASKTPAGSAATNPTVSVPAGQDRFIPLPYAAADPTTGLITVNHSFTTSVTSALLRM